MNGEECMQLALVIFLVALAASLISRASRYLGMAVEEDDAEAEVEGEDNQVCVLTCSSAHGNWTDVFRHVMSHASDPRKVRIHVLLECTEFSDVAKTGSVDSEFLPYVRIVHAKKNDDECTTTTRARRLLRRFAPVIEEGVLVVVMDADVQLVHGWDHTLRKLIKCHDGGHDPPRVLSVAVSEFESAFPTLDAKGYRSSATAFSSSAHINAIVPSVCWCPEFTAGTVPDLLAFERQALSATHVTTNALLLRPVTDERMRARYVLETQNVGRDVVTANECVGLTRDADMFERIVKYGNSRVSDLAVEFA